MNYNEWEKSVPDTFKNDPLWNMEVYRISLFLAEIGWIDVTKLMKDARTLTLSDQLYRSIGSISANIEEGYSRGSNKDRTRFYEYSLGSSRESRGWYYKARYILGDKVVNHRIGLLTSIIRLLLKVIQGERGYSVHEKSEFYLDVAEKDDQTQLNRLLSEIPFPE
ncbi:MAG: four helix bundle protein [Methanobacteriota archaeon]|nr:MAG: four helix bundle protein [Euryarchaeota archaeon]